MNIKATEHVEHALNEIRTMYLRAATRIEALKPGEKIPATELANELAKEQGMTGAQLYPVLRTLLEGYPGVDIRRGAHGGIYKLAAGELPGQKKTATVTATSPVVAHIATETICGIPVSFDPSCDVTPITNG